ncbi:ABC transporter ATP-binding protein [Paenibacillus donghaensis]|uniref:Bacitracin ABC transporter ATP-binding protein n=1 Tax=Paenibacillus donghaensis TaxID=414771 RepID=A0A2Z2KN09_9BACL|nr:ABC transporter ATP-binding protein [Paenibacillus donghaensis]ASA22552.1 bacitracin ABC transporter ATP-binding protein [Paenibacillus donghaensis]
MTKSVIQTQDLTRRISGKTTVDQVNLFVKEGGIYGFLGPNGAGKTTTIRMLLGLTRPTSGDIYIFGKLLASHRISILKNIGSLVESPSFYGHLTARENLEIVRRITAVPASAVEDALRTVRLDKASNRFVREYSLGMKQRLGIATALLGLPKLLILDEPTNGLDPAGIQEIRELIKELPRRYGMSVLVSSHLLNEIDQMASEVGILVEGQLIFQGAIESLRKRSSPYLRIGVERPDYAAAILRQSGCNIRVDGEFLYSEETNHEAAAGINRLLHEAGHHVFRLEEVKRSLEDIFLEITGKGSSL